MKQERWLHHSSANDCGGFLRIQLVQNHQGVAISGPSQKHKNVFLGFQQYLWKTFSDMIVLVWHGLQLTTNAMFNGNREAILEEKKEKERDQIGTPSYWSEMASYCRRPALAAPPSQHYRVSWSNQPLARAGGPLTLNQLIYTDQLEGPRGQKPNQRH